MTSRFNTRLERLEKTMATEPAGPLVERLLALLKRLEDATGNHWTYALHDDACPRGWSGQGRLRTADAVNASDVITWFVAALQHPNPPPLCPLCTSDPTEEAA